MGRGPVSGGNGETGLGDDEQAAFVELDLHSRHVLFLRAELGRRGNEIRRRPGERIGGGGVARRSREHRTVRAEHDRGGHLRRELHELLECLRRIHRRATLPAFSER